MVCLRVLMHTPDWRQSLGELCRVARHRVVFDYPALVKRGGAAGADAARRRRRWARASRPTVSSAIAPMRATLSRAAASGWSGSHRQFVLPIALHKRLGLGWP